VSASLYYKLRRKLESKLLQFYYTKQVPAIDSQMTIAQDLPNHSVMGSLSPWLWRKVYITKLLTERSQVKWKQAEWEEEGRKEMDHTVHAESNWFCIKEFHQQEDFEALILTRFCFGTIMEFSPLSNGPKKTASHIILISSRIKDKTDRTCLLGLGKFRVSFSSLLSTS